MTTDDPQQRVHLQPLDGLDARRRGTGGGQGAATVAYDTFMEALATGDRTALRLARARLAAAQAAEEPDQDDDAQFHLVT